ncbi:TPA: hypothetical protein N0F65_005195 [Lagenidium giganteum]|uniref:Temptin Cys/Cys disulfide domain-containing protein n=1 Tax=Lagenidium giganteum TaxID=4803 RepID=A0AAV2Z3L6_9STRA|nr:TPA: hypothetical protein N0F65_005195 [Lagenidium giganteum]
MPWNSKLPFTLFAVTAWSLPLEARREYVSRLPNGDGVPNVPALGHSDPNGGNGRLNAFGDDFDSYGKKWTLGLCEADSDSDGQTNGEELGDPCCEWDKSINTKVRWSTGLSDPGNKSSKSDSSLWASLNCSNVTQISGAQPMASGSSLIVTLIATIAAVALSLSAQVLAPDF